MSQGQATNYKPGDMDNMKQEDSEHGQSERMEEKGSRRQSRGQNQQVSTSGEPVRQVSKRGRGRRDDMSLFDWFSNDIVPSFFRGPSLLGMFNEPYFNSVTPAVLTPHVDVYETENNYMIDVELPGMKKEDVSIKIEDDFLIISGEKKFEKDESDKKNKYRRKERMYGTFTRSFEIPSGVEHDKIEAKYNHGVLTVSVPKPEGNERTTGRSIEIKDVTE